MANGGIRCADDVATVAMATGCQGIMSGRALLRNPALFAVAEGVQYSQEQQVQMLYDCQNKVSFMTSWAESNAATVETADDITSMDTSLGTSCPSDMSVAMARIVSADLMYYTIKIEPHTPHLTHLMTTLSRGLVSLKGMTEYKLFSLLELSTLVSCRSNPKIVNWWHDHVWTSKII